MSIPGFKKGTKFNFCQSTESTYLQINTYAHSIFTESTLANMLADSFKMGPTAHQESPEEIIT
ncbi:2758_t:CDS:1, partial [Acaulospora morrowiae]